MPAYSEVSPAIFHVQHAKDCGLHVFQKPVFSECLFVKDQMMSVQIYHKRVIPRYTLTDICQFSAFTTFETLSFIFQK